MHEEDQIVPARELADALVSVLGSDGRPGLLHPDRAERFRRCIYSRSRALDILGLQAVRLAALMHSADPRGYWNFLYRLPRFQTRHFRQALVTAFKLGRLKGRYEIDDKSVHFLSPGDSFRGERFSLSFNQMPYAAALLDLLHNALGLAEVQRILTPLFVPASEAGLADRVADELRKTFELWLKDRLESEYHIRQNRAIGEYLQALKFAQARFFRLRDAAGDREMVETRLNGEAEEAIAVTDWHRARWPAAYTLFKTVHKEAWSDPEEALFSRRADLIQDQTILGFWMKLVISDPSLMDQIGFRRYRSAAYGMLLHKYALDRSVQERDIVQATSLTMEKGDELEFDTSGREADRDGNRRLEDEKSEGEDQSFDVEAWVSPLSVLVSPPCDTVKWLAGTDIDFLGGIIAGGSKRHRPLFGVNRPDSRFMTTLLRYICFGDIQEVAINNAGNPGKFWPETNGYELAVARLAKLDARTRELAYATVQALLHRRDSAALSLLHELEPGTVAEIGRTAGRGFHLADVDRLVELVAEAIATAGNPVGSRVRSSYKNTDRAGFRDRDANDPQFDEALNAGADAVAPLHADVKRIAEWYKAKDLSALYLADTPRFETALRKLYGSVEGSTA